MQFNTPLSVRLRMDPSITPQELLVLIYTGSLVYINACKSGCRPWYRATKSLLRCPNIGFAMAAYIAGGNFGRAGNEQFVAHVANMPGRAELSRLRI